MWVCPARATHQTGWSQEQVEDQITGDVHRWIQGPREYSRKDVAAYISVNCNRVDIAVTDLVDTSKADQTAIRFDLERGSAWPVTYVDEGDYLEFINLAEPKRLINKMKIHNTMKVRFYTWRNQANLVEFSLAGFTQAYNQLGC